MQPSAALTALDSADVIPVDSGLQPQLLLRKPTLLPEAVDSSAKTDYEALGLHNVATLPPDVRLGYSPIVLASSILDQTGIDQDVRITPIGR